MSWIAPTSADVLSELSPGEADALKEALGGTTTTQKVDPILVRVVLEIRGYILAGSYPLDADTTKLPPSLLSDAVVMTRWRLLMTLPAANPDPEQSDPRENAYKASLKKLGMIADGEWPLESPTPVTSTFPSTGNWNSENKLIMRTHPVPKPSVQITETANDYANS